MKMLAGAIATLFVSALVLPAVGQATATPDKENIVAPGNNTTPSSTNTLSNGREATPGELPDSPGTILAKSTEPVQSQAGGEPQWTAALLAPQDTPAQSSQATEQSSHQRPVGTAAAEAAPTSGVAASQPAGVAIAPAKQRRVRTIVLRVGAIIGAGVAVGSVVALSEATSSKPPGAH
jgi:hypothetical protein